MMVYYFGPDNDRPSWGLGMIYYHVWLLNKNNIDSILIHNKRSFRLTWLDIDVPIVYMEDRTLVIQKDDILVVPEFHASDPWVQKITCKKIVFVQNAFYLFDGLKLSTTYEKLGYASVFYYLPHLRDILQEITTLPLYETPAFIAPYYFLQDKVISRQKRVLIYPKFHQRDYNILRYLLNEKLNLKPENKIRQFLTSSNSWSLIELEKLTHKEVARQMKKAVFFISLNTTEAFNSAVPEAMAAGCINICYNGIGPRDFLIDGRNAFVFENNDIFKLSRTVVDLISEFEVNSGIIDQIRQHGFTTAANFKIESLEKALISFFNKGR